MADSMVHRGPDDAGVQEWPSAGLAFRRLALVDIAGGHQPASDEQGRFWSVFNGEIYNHAELRRELVGLGHRLNGSGDADLVPHLYEQWGPAMLGRRMQTVSCRTWLPCSILMKADKMSMAHSLEVRVPYLDRDVLAVASRLPKRLRIDGVQTKVALRAAASALLPADVANRPKLGFPVPFRSWLAGEVPTGCATCSLRATAGFSTALDCSASLTAPGEPRRSVRCGRS